MSASDAEGSRNLAIKPTQTHTSTSIFSGDAMRRGVYEEVDSCQDPGVFVPPTIERIDQLSTMFFGLLLGYEGVERRLQDAAMLYGHKVSTQPDDLLSHFVAWDVWEDCKEKGCTLDDFWTKRVSTALNGWKRYDVPDKYGQAIRTLCEQLRLGSTWPRLLHSAVITYRRCVDRPGCNPGICSFAPNIIPNPVTNAGFWVFNRVKLTVPGGHEVIVSPDESREHALARVDDLDVRVSLRKDWPKIRRKMSSLVGYRRRKKLVAGQQHIEWLYRWHILGEKADEIAGASMVSPSVVEDTVKALRKQLDLQTSRSVRSRGSRRRLPRL